MQSTEINTSRRALINYIAARGDTFADTSTFIIDGINEDFTGATLQMVIRLNGNVVMTLTQDSGISVMENSLTYTISSSDMHTYFKPGKYEYYVKKTVGSITETIQYGCIQVQNNFSI